MPVMTCEHLRDLEQAMLAAGIRETFRGQAWSEHCREWVYFDCWMDLDLIRQCHSLSACVVDHAHRGTHDGAERGLVCRACEDALMGSYEPRAGQACFPRLNSA
jgi:hypothetical protein